MGAVSAAIMGGMMLGGAYLQAESQKNEAKYQEKMFELNARMANQQAEDAIKRGDKEAQAHKQKVKGLIGSQRAAMAAQGLDLSDGSALEIQQDTAELGAQDALNIKNNAWREAWGYRVQAADMTGRGRMTAMAGQNNYRNTLIAGGLQAARYGAGSYKGGRQKQGGELYYSREAYDAGDYSF